MRIKRNYKSTRDYEMREGDAGKETLKAHGFKWTLGWVDTRHAVYFVYRGLYDLISEVLVYAWWVVFLWVFKINYMYIVVG